MIGAAVVSAGVAFSLAAMPTLITESAPIHQTASANGFNSLLRSVGTSTGSAVAAAVLAGSTVVIGASAVPTCIRSRFCTGSERAYRHWRPR